MKANEIIESGIYLVIGPEDLVSMLPTQNILFLYPNGDLVCEGDNFRTWQYDEEFDQLDVICIAKAENYPCLREGNV